MTIRDLRKYRENLEKLECIERQLNRRYTSETVEGSTGAPSFEKVSRTVDGYIHGAGTVSLLAEKSKLLHENEQIEDFIFAIPKKRIYEALYHYCLNTDLENPTWKDVAKEVGEPDARALHKAIERYLKDIEICPVMSNVVY